MRMERAANMRNGADDIRFTHNLTVNGDRSVIPKGKVKLNKLHSAFERDKNFVSGGFCGEFMTRFSKGWIRRDLY